MNFSSRHGYESISEIERGSIKEKIRLQLLSEYRNRLGSSLSLITNKGKLIPLKAIANWEERLGTSTLKRQDQLPRASVQFSLADMVAPNVSLRIVKEIAAQVLPETVSGKLDRSATAVTSTMQNTIILLLAAALVMYIVLGILYESFIHPLTILSSLPFGGALTLFLFNEPISLFSAVGFLFLIGIGEGSEMQRGLGLVIGGGLLFSQLLTLYVTPIFYLTFDRLFSTQDQAALLALE